MLDTFCPTCFFIKMPTDSPDDRKQKSLGLLYQKREHITKNIQALTTSMDPSGEVLKYYNDLLNRCDLKIEETTNI